MDAVAITALVTAIFGGVVSLATVYVQLRGQIDKNKRETQAEIVSGYQDLLVRSTAQADVFREEIRKEKEEGRKESKESRSEFHHQNEASRSFFAAQLDKAFDEFSRAIREERAIFRKESMESRKALAAIAEQNAIEHRAIVSSIDELRDKLSGAE